MSLDFRRYVSVNRMLALLFLKVSVSFDLFFDLISFLAPQRENWGKTTQSSWIESNSLAISDIVVSTHAT